MVLAYTKAFYNLVNMNANQDQTQADIINLLHDDRKLGALAAAIRAHRWATHPTIVETSNGERLKLQEDSRHLETALETLSAQTDQETTLIKDNALIKEKSLDLLLKAPKIYIAPMIQTGRTSTIFSAPDRSTSVGTRLEAGSLPPGSDPSSLRRSAGPAIHLHASRPVDDAYFQSERDRVQQQRGFNVRPPTWSPVHRQVGLSIS